MMPWAGKVSRAAFGQRSGTAGSTNAGPVWGHQVPAPHSPVSAPKFVDSIGSRSRCSRPGSRSVRLAGALSTRRKDRAVRPEPGWARPWVILELHQPNVAKKTRRLLGVRRPWASATRGGADLYDRRLGTPKLSKSWSGDREKPGRFLQRAALITGPVNQGARRGARASGLGFLVRPAHRVGGRYFPADGGEGQGR